MGDIDRLKSVIAALWQMENELRYSSWDALSAEKQQAVDYVRQARERLNVLLNK